MALVFATIRELEKLSERLDQLDKDMEAIAVAIKRNNENTQAILDAIDSAQRVSLIGNANASPH